MKKGFVFLILAIGVGCGSSQKQEPVTTEASSAPSQAPAEVSRPAPPEPMKSAPVAVTKEPQTTYQKLQQFIRQQNWKSVEEEALTILEQQPQDIVALNAIGLANYHQKKPLAAKYFLSKAIELSPNDPSILNNLGLVSKQEGETREAISYWRRAIDSRKGKSDAALANLVSEFAMAKDYKKVTGAASRLDVRRVDDIGLLINIGVAYMATNQISLAERSLSRALELDSNNRFALINLAILEVEHKKSIDQGRKHLDRISFLGVQSDMQATVTLLEKRIQEMSQAGGQ